MTNPAFSVIIPTYNRPGQLMRALTNLMAQTYKEFEIIIVNDGSLVPYPPLPLRLRARMETFTVNKGKLAARNAGMKMAKNDWIVWLDDDDELVSTYLESFAEAIREFPDSKVFNCGFLRLDMNNRSTRYWAAFEPEIKDGKVLPFKSGQITTGSFIFHRSLLKDLGDLPETKIAYGTDDSFAGMAAKKWKSIERLYGKDKEGQWQPFGNPFGDDWYTFFILTHVFNNIPKAIQLTLYIQHAKK